MISMSELGILIYGYSENDVMAIVNTIGKELETKIHVYGSSGKEDMTVQDILEEATWGGFGDREHKILMLLGFGDEQVGVALASFPSEIQRPIFCGLTEENIGWKISYLVEHLLEEERYWKEQARKKRDLDETGA